MMTAALNYYWYYQAIRPVATLSDLVLLIERSATADNNLALSVATVAQIDNNLELVVRKLSIMRN